ncbi:MAG: aminopeptidase N [Pseudohongiellaceae bacterium]|jgi:aminopeptidase N
MKDTTIAGSSISWRRNALGLKFSWMLALFFPASVFAQAIAGLDIQQGVSWDLAQHRQSTISDIHYRFALRIPETKQEPIQAEAKIEFTWQDDSMQPLVLDFLAPMERVNSLLVNGTPVSWVAINDHIVIVPEVLTTGVNSIELTFTAGNEAFNRNDDFLYALFVPDRAHFSLPLFDQPNLKGRVAWQVTAPGQWQVIANGPEESAITSGDETRHIFAETQPMPTYLFAVAAGLFEKETAVVNGREFNMYHRETDEEKVQRNKEEIFKLHGSTVAWLEEYTQIGYPFKKFDFVLVPSFQYGGMEHPGSILYRQASLMLDETATQSQILGRASLIAHETAHMWFGDLVTMNWFDDVWTKEVFANFMAAKIVNPSFPEVNHELRFLTAHHPSAYAVDRTAGANQIRQPLDNLRYAGTLYGAIIYQKAPIVMRHLENRVGEDAFRDGMREYLATYAYGNATWPDLIAILDRQTSEDLAAWSRVWVEEAGRPSISVIRQGEQTQLRQQDPLGGNRIWPQTLNVLMGSAQEYELTAIELDSSSINITNTANPQFILPNGSGVEYGNFVLDAQSQSYLLENIGSFEDALVRGAIWITLWDQVLGRRLTPDSFYDALMQALPSEQDELLVARMLGYLSSVYWSLLLPETRNALSTEVEALLWGEVQSNRSQSSRSAFYGAYRSMAISSEGIVRLKRLWANAEEVQDLPLSEVDKINLASGLAIRGVSDWQEILDKQEQQIENPDRLARFRFLRDSLSQDINDRDRFFESLRLVENRNREAWVGAGLDNLHHPLRANSSLHYIRPALELLEEIQATGDIFFPSRWLSATLDGHTSEEAADIVARFLVQSETLSSRLRLKVLQSADGIFRSASILHGRPVD